MIFSSIEFIIFFALVLLGLIFLRNRNKARKTLLLAASWYFYAYWDWRFLGLILLSTIVDFWVGHQLGVTTNKKIRRRLLAASLVVNLGLLGFFKYYNFFIDSLRPLIKAIGMHAETLDIILPVGISFYTFQTLSYTIDIYRKDMKPHGSLLDFALFVGFFPQLVAGPIVRASHFLPQLKEYRPITCANCYIGFQRFTYGLFKKIFIADRLAIFSDYVFANAGAFDCVTTWLAAIAYSLQIYFDFSGYSDMAIGVARIMGYDLGENFNFPYLSKSPREFWRRWHISLSTWIRDYVYIPLGGSWKGPRRAYLNVFFAMLLCGLWHGPAWTFVAWGGGHGLALVGSHVLMHYSDVAASSLKRAFGWFATTFFVVLSWVLFRSEGFGKMSLMFRQMFLPEPGLKWYFPFVPFVLVGIVVVHVIKSKGLFDSWFQPSSARTYSPALLFSLLWLSIIFQPADFNPFIYFQF